MAESYMELLQPKLDSLQAALDSFAVIDGHIDDFVRSLAASEGQDIEYTKEGFNGIKVHRIKGYTEKIEEVMQKLTANAEMMDAVLNKWKDRAAENYVIESTNSDVTKTGTKKFPGLNGSTTDYYTFTGTKTEILADSATIGADGYILVHTKQRVTTYSGSSFSDTMYFAELVNSGSSSSEISEGPDYSYGFDS